MKPIGTIAEAIKHIENVAISKSEVELGILNSPQDPVGINMAIILDKLLGLDFMPDGFEQKDGFRIYKYKRGT